MQINETRLCQTNMQQAKSQHKNIQDIKIQGQQETDTVAADCTSISKESLRLPQSKRKRMVNKLLGLYETNILSPAKSQKIILECSKEHSKVKKAPAKTVGTLAKSNVVASRIVHDDSVSSEVECNNSCMFSTEVDIAADRAKVEESARTPSYQLKSSETA